MDKKYSTGVLGVLLMGLSSLFPVAFPESMALWYWRVFAALVFLAGVGFMGWQGRILTRADKITDKRWDELSGAMAQLAPIVKETLALPGANDLLSMRILRSVLLPKSWAREFTDMIYRQQGKALPKVEFDYICELNVVNQGNPPVTLEKFGAMIKVAGRDWEQIKPVHDLTPYQTKKKDDRLSRKDLPNLLDKVGGVPLVSGVGYRGFIAFRFEATTDELKTPVQVETFAIDAAGKRHETTLPTEPAEFDDDITYSIKSLRGE